MIDLLDGLATIALFGFLIWTQWVHEKRIEQIEKDIYGPDEDDDSEPWGRGG